MRASAQSPVQHKHFIYTYCPVSTIDQVSISSASLGIVGLLASAHTPAQPSETYDPEERSHNLAHTPAQVITVYKVESCPVPGTFIPHLTCVLCTRTHCGIYPSSLPIWLPLCSFPYTVNFLCQYGISLVLHVWHTNGCE